MAEVRSRSGRRAYCVSASVALGMHAVLWWSMPAAGHGPQPAEPPVWIALSDNTPPPRPQPITPTPPPLAATAPTAPPAVARAHALAARRHTLRPKPAAGAGLSPAQATSTDAAPTAASQQPPSKGAPDTQNAAQTSDALSGAQVARATSSAPSGPAQSPATRKLAHGPRLLSTHNPCAAFFPEHSTIQHGQVQLIIEVDAVGHAHASRTLLEVPASQGFAAAASACAQHLNFAPALDLNGHPVQAYARVELRFDRHLR